MARFSRDLFLTLGTQILSIGVGVGSGVLTARVLGPEHRGIYSLCITLGMTVASMASFELGPSAIYQIARLRAPAGRVVAAVVALGAALGTLVAAALWLGRPLVFRAFDALSAEPLLWVALLIPLALLDTTLSQVFRATNRFVLFNAHALLLPGLQLAALAAAFLAGGGLVEALQAIVASQAVVLLFTALALWVVARPRLRGSRALWGPMFRYGARIEAASVLGYLQLRISLFLVAYYLSPEDIAFYAIADALVGRLLTIPNTIGTVLLPKIAAESDATAADMTAAVSRSTLFLMVGTALALGAVAVPLVDLLYGAEYLPSVAPLWALLPLAVFRSGSRVLTRFLLATNHTSILVGLNVIALVAHVGLLLVLVPRYGTVGAAAAASAGYMMHTVGCVLVFRSISSIGVTRVLLVGRADLGLMLDALRSRRGGEPGRGAGARPKT